MKRKSIILAILVVALAVFGVACGNKNDAPAKETKTETKEEAKTEEPAGMTGEIHVVSREDGSGTRGAFTEITGVLQKENGEETDKTFDEAIVQNSTNAVITTVSGDEASIGYISLGSLSDVVKAVKVDGHEATAEKVKSGEYAVARPFNIAYREDKITDLGKDFLAFIMSEEGQKIAEDHGYVSNGNTGAYTPSNMEGSLTIGGSTSVTPLMENLVDAYKAHNPGFKADIQATGSSAGMTAAMEGAVEIGMASRELKDKEKEALTSEVIAMDGIAVIVNNENSIEDISMDNIRQIFTGELRNWEEVK